LSFIEEESGIQRAVSGVSINTGIRRLDKTESRDYDYTTRIAVTATKSPTTCFSRFAPSLGLEGVLVVPAVGVGEAGDGMLESVLVMVHVKMPEPPN